MKLADFLALSPSDKKIKDRILALMAKSTGEAKEDPSQQLRKLICRLDAAVIIRLAIASTDIQRFCEADLFKNHWEDLWRQSGMNPRELALVNHEPIRENQPIRTLSCFALLKSFYIYQGYRRLTKENEMSDEIYEQAKEYLKLSAHFGCFQALNVLCIEGLKLLRNKPDITIATAILGYAQQAANLHWTPGYFLLSTVYQELIFYRRAIFPSDPNVSGKVLLTKAFIALHTAQKLEPFSNEMLNNAYQGKSLQEASKGKFKNWFLAKQRLLELSNGLLILSDKFYTIINGQFEKIALNHNFLERFPETEATKLQAGSKI